MAFEADKHTLAAGCKLVVFVRRRVVHAAAWVRRCFAAVAACKVCIQLVVAVVAVGVVVAVVVRLVRAQSVVVRQVLVQPVRVQPAWIRPAWVRPVWDRLVWVRPVRVRLVRDRLQHVFRSLCKKLRPLSGRCRNFYIS